MKAKLRVWLIDLVREAIKLEAKQALGLNGNEYTHLKANTKSVAAIKRAEPEIIPQKTEKGAGFTITFTPSFEQMQAEALKAQEKYYEPA